jgi:hypothetical protein
MIASLLFCAKKVKAQEEELTAKYGKSREKRNSSLVCLSSSPYLEVTLT